MNKTNTVKKQRRTYYGLLYLLYLLFFDRKGLDTIYYVFNNVITTKERHRSSTDFNKAVRKIIINIVADLFILAGIITVALSLTIPVFLPLLPYGLGTIELGFGINSIQSIQSGLKYSTKADNIFGNLLIFLGVALTIASFFFPPLAPILLAAALGVTLIGVGVIYFEPIKRLHSYFKGTTIKADNMIGNLLIFVGVALMIASVFFPPLAPILMAAAFGVILIGVGVIYFEPIKGLHSYFKGTTNTTATNDSNSNNANEIKKKNSENFDLSAVDLSSPESTRLFNFNFSENISDTDSNRESDDSYSKMNKSILGSKSSFKNNVANVENTQALPKPPNNSHDSNVKNTQSTSEQSTPEKTSVDSKSDLSHSITTLKK